MIHLHILFCNGKNDKLIRGYANVIYHLAEYFEELLIRQTTDERETQLKNDECEMNKGNYEPLTVDEISRNVMDGIRKHTPYILCFFKKKHHIPSVF